MPPTTLHMVIARQIGLDLATDAIEAQHGAYLLGASTPDIRVITKQDRMSTHFFDLNIHDHQDSVAAFLAAHPSLADAGRLNGETRAFAAGYISHLVMDEQYITEIYRRFFAQHEELGGRIRANVMDRLLQFHLDGTYCNDPELKTSVCGALAATVENIQAGFIETKTLEQWRGVMLEMAARTMDWERIRGMVSNHLRIGGLQEGETLTSFLDSLPELLDETIAHITSAEVAAFVGRSTEATRSAVARYLGCE